MYKAVYTLMRVQQRPDFKLLTGFPRVLKKSYIYFIKFKAGVREQGVLRVLQHPLFFSVGNCKLLNKKYIYRLYIYIIYCIFILEYLGFAYEKRFDYVWVLSYSIIQIKSQCVLLTNQICCCRLQRVITVTLRDVISVRHEAHEHVAKENLWVFQKP